MKIDPALRDELVCIINAVTILSLSAFTFAGRPSNGIAMSMIGLQLTHDMPPLTSELAGQLYQHCFSNRFIGQMTVDEMSPAAIDDEALKPLSRANQSQERWEDGWQVVHSMLNGQVVANRGGVTRTLAPGEFVNLSGSGMILSPGATVRVYVPRESYTVQPGYYFAFGETSPDSSDEFSIVRFYWNVSAEGTAELFQLITAELNRWQLPFRIKTGIHRGMFARSDSAVLYTPRRYADFAFELLSEIHKRVLPLLRNDVPLFTLRLAPGLAFAEDPGTQESFGMSRCRILAHGIWLAHQQGAQDVEERLTIVEQHFHAEGISLERPWLNAGSADEFRFTALCEEAA
jgi:HopA1 effector protein family